MTASPEWIIKIGHQKLGDFLLATPALKAWEKTCPNTLFAVPTPLFEIYKKGNVFENCIPQSEVEQTIKRRDGRTRVLDLSYPLLHFKSRDFIERLPGDPFKKKQHSGVSYYESLKILEPKLPDDFEALPFLANEPDEEFLSLHQLSPFRYFTIHPGAGEKHKHWGNENFELVVKKLLADYPHLKCVSLMGPNEQPLFQDSEKPAGFIEFRGPLHETAEILAGSMLHLDNDSGIHHLAGAMDVPSVTVFGITGPGTWSSLTKRNLVLWGGPACQEHCHGFRAHQCKDRVCMTSITPDLVSATCQKVLEQYVLN